jgi:hypothetical protein
VQKVRTDTYALKRVKALMREWRKQSARDRIKEGRTSFAPKAEDSAGMRSGESLMVSASEGVND